VPDAGTRQSGRVTLVDLAAARRGDGPYGAGWNGIGAEARRVRTELAERALGALWAEAAGEAPGLALGAVGSLGGGDLGPRSDLDLVLIYDDRVAGQAAADGLAPRLWYPIWDAGLDLDYSVRSLADCRRVAARDLPAVTGLLNLRPIAGDAELAGRAASAVLADWRAQTRRRLPELAEDLAARAGRFGELAYSLEPDLKASRGGLRDAKTLRALTATWLADRPHTPAVDRARARILDVRDALQAVTGRATNRLMRVDQAEVAARLGLQDADALLAALAAEGRAIAYATDVTLRRAQHNLMRGRVPRPLLVRGRRRAPRLASLGPGLAEHEGEVVLDRPPAQDPTLALCAAVQAATRGLPLSPATARSLAAAPVPARPWAPDVLALFCQLLGAGARLVGVWEALDQAGVIEGLLPEWAAVRNRPQHNPLHRFTVDRHLIETAAIAGPLAATVDRPDVLLLAALFHDFGKQAPPGGAVQGQTPPSGIGRGASTCEAPPSEGHAERGARLAGPILEGLGVPPDQKADIVRLIREHLTLARLATTRDPDDPATACALLARLDGRADLVIQLRALTEADARATGPKAWSRVRAQLIDQLPGAALAAAR
jgi:[protein-PII] uridylyltransferase